MDLLHPGWVSRWGGRGHHDTRWARYAEPWRFYELAGRPVRALLASAVLLLAAGVWGVADPGMADADRLLALHLSLAWLALAWAAALAVAAAVGRLTRGPLPSLLIEAMAPTAALATLLAVATSAMWQQSSGGLLPPWEPPVPAAAWPWVGAALAQSVAAVLLRVRLVIVERARRGLEQEGGWS